MLLLPRRCVVRGWRRLVCWVRRGSRIRGPLRGWRGSLGRIRVLWGRLLLLLLRLLLLLLLLVVLRVRILGVSRMLSGMRMLLRWVSVLLLRRCRCRD